MASSNSVPKFVDGRRVWVGQVSAANPNRDGTGTIVTILTAGNVGSLIELVRVEAIVTTTAGFVRLFIHDGSNYRLYKEIPVTAATPSGTVAAFSAEYIPTQPLALQSGYSLRASTENAEAMNVIVTGGDY
jgi:hypothetical protein